MNLQTMMKRDMQTAVKSGGMNSANVQFLWLEDAGAGSGTFDANVEGSYPETREVSGTARALVHFVQPIKSGIRQFAEIQPGDVILDMQPTAMPAPEGADGLKCVIDGQTYVQKDAGKELAQYWDLVVGGERMMRTLLMTRAM